MVTIEQVSSWRPCYPDERVIELFAGRESLSVDDITALEIPSLDKIWALLHLLDDKELRLFGCWCVRHTPVSDGRVVWDLLTDERSRRTVEVAEAYAEGRASMEELQAAWAAAAEASRAAAAAAWTAARAAAEAAAREAAAAARAVASREAAAAARTAAAEVQLANLIAKAKEG